MRNTVFKPPTQRSLTKAYQIKTRIQLKLQLTQTAQSGSLQRPTANKDEREKEREGTEKIRRGGGTDYSEGRERRTDERG